MTPADIYATPAILTSKDIYPLLRRSLPEVSCDIEESRNTRVEIREHFYYDCDGTRYIQISSVWLDGHPVMIFREAGRGGKDEYDRFITDRGRFVEMVSYLSTLLCIREDSEEIVDPLKDDPRLTRIYGVELELSDFTGKDAHSTKP